MRAVHISAYDGKPQSISVVDMPTPSPGPGEVLVKVFASPVNPSDLAFLLGRYGFKKPLPAVPGFEGSGTVVSAGPGALGTFLKGKRVACGAADAKIAGGMWADYVVTSAKLCIPLLADVNLEQGAVMLVNPMTAWALMEEARRGRHKALVQTAAASALGRMIIRLGRRFSISVINVVRRAEQVELLREEGAEHVIDSSAARFENSLRDLCHQFGATIGFDAVAGELSGTILQAQPPGARLLVYGGLSFGPCQLDPTLLIFEGKRLEGFWLSRWLRSKSLLGLLRVSREVQKLLGTDLKTEFQARVPLTDAAGALRQYVTNMTAGKVLLMPELSREDQ